MDGNQNILKKKGLKIKIAPLGETLPKKHQNYITWKKPLSKLSIYTSIVVISIYIFKFVNKLGPKLKSLILDF